MTTTSTPTDTTPPAPSATRGHGALLVPAILGVVSTLVVIGVLRMEVPAEATFPGPRFFPTLLAVAGYLLTALLTVHYLRHPDRATAGEHRTHSDWGAFAWVAGGFLVFAVLLDLLGWILGAALLFWCVARGFGSTRPGFDTTVALVVSSGIYLVFGTGLGLPLPSGLLGGL
ncbi:tripartite tricarboxylate transporter TctB family protein [Nocardioides panacisoli]|uniref:tripartite tricarboxylate transporter TctB family protein n=1 Tax=Nocardioides panacisoli TaxID=627624 RepID=UPI001F287CDA|nr:tripartite tricarboxylate transporter TctB family protein [Nocardioides panacisoli]